MLDKLFVPPALVDENIAGIDIGKTGGIVHNYFGVLEVENTSLRSTLKALQECHRAIAENVHPMPKQGIVSSGTLMLQKGMVIGVCAAKGVELDFIEPLEWIKCYTLKRTKHFETKTKWKRHLMEIAKVVFPREYSDMITLHNADAFLIWNYFASLRIGNPLPEYGQLNLFSNRPDPR
jgi:hypothetical protein